MKVLLLHAFPLDERMWEPQLESLRDYDVSTPRLYGRGESVDDWAASLLGEQDGELVLVGASLGGYAALAMTSRAPERVRALALVGARAEGDSPERRAVRQVSLNSWTSAVRCSPRRSRSPQKLAWSASTADRSATVIGSMDSSTRLLSVRA